MPQRSFWEMEMPLFRKIPPPALGDPQARILEELKRFPVDGATAYELADVITEMNYDSILYNLRVMESKFTVWRQEGGREARTFLGRRQDVWRAFDTPSVE